MLLLVHLPVMFSPSFRYDAKLATIAPTSPPMIARTKHIGINFFRSLFSYSVIFSPLTCFAISVTCFPHPHYISYSYFVNLFSLFFLTKYLTLLIIVLLAVYKVLRRNTGGNKTFNNVMQGLSDAIGA